VGRGSNRTSRFISVQCAERPIPIGDTRRESPAPRVSVCTCASRGTNAIQWPNRGSLTARFAPASVSPWTDRAILACFDGGVGPFQADYAAGLISRERCPSSSPPKAVAHGHHRSIISDKPDRESSECDTNDSQRLDGGNVLVSPAPQAALVPDAEPLSVRRHRRAQSDSGGVPSTGFDGKNT